MQLVNWQRQCALLYRFSNLCCCTVYTLRFTFVQFVLYQQLLLAYSLLCIQFLHVVCTHVQGCGKTMEIPPARCTAVQIPWGFKIAGIPVGVHTFCSAQLCGFTVYTLHFTFNWSPCLRRCSRIAGIVVAIAFLSNKWGMHFAWPSYVAVHLYTLDTLYTCAVHTGASITSVEVLWVNFS